MKPNNARLNLLFDFCLKELLRHLHRDARKNIVFVFTNARGTFYKPGDTYDALQAALSANKSIWMELNHENIYCMDNESLRFLAACNCGVEFTEREKQIFSESWDQAVEETTRLLQHIRSLPPHGSEGTVTLNEVRRKIAALSRPLALITENIKHNIQACEDQTKLIEERQDKKKDLQSVLYVPVIDLKHVTLGFPQTVCTASKCMEVRQMHGQSVNHYKTICHYHCKLKGIPEEKFPEPRLQKCGAMKGGTDCKNCGCHWGVHMHITYTHESVETKAEHQTTKDSITTEEQGIQKEQDMKRLLSERINEYRGEEKILLEVSAEFGAFLKNTAILPYNDALKEYLLHMIKEERQKESFTGSKSQTLDGLEKSLKEYNEEVRVLEMAMLQGTRSSKSPKEMEQLMDKIFNLRHFGRNIREGLTANTAGQMKEHKVTEISFRIPPKKN